MDKKVMYGLGAVALLGAIWYFKNKSQVAPEEVAEEEASPEEAGGGAGGGGGAPAPSPSDMAMGEVAKEELRKSMDLGGLDMASPKAEKGAVVTGMVASMVSKGKEVSPTLARAMLRTSLPTPTKDKIVNKVVKGTDVSRGAKSIFNQNKPTRDVAPKPTLGNTISKAVAKTPQAQVYKAVNKAIVKDTPQISKAVAKPVAQVSRVVAKPVAQVSKAVVKATPKPVAQVNRAISKAVTKPVAKISAPFKRFDGEDMFENAVSTNKQCRWVNEIVGYSPTGSGEPIIERKLVCVSTSNTARFDGADDMSNFSGASDF